MSKTTRVHFGVLHLASLLECRAPQAVLPINLILYLLIKCNNSTFVQITVFMFIFGLPTLANHKERTRELGLSEIHGARKGLGRLHETLDKYISKRLYFYFKELQLFQKITIKKTVLYILENYNQQQPLKAKTTRKRKGKPKKEK